MQSICNRCGKALAPGNPICSQCQPSVPFPAQSDFDFSVPPPPASNFVPDIEWQRPFSIASNARLLKIAGSIATGCLVILVYLVLRSYANRPVPEDNDSGVSVLESNSAAMDRQRIGTDGMPMLNGPTVPGGPTFGEGKWADLEIVDFGWNFYGPQKRPRSVSRPFVTVKNKSSQVWNDVRVHLVLTDAFGKTTETEILVGKIAQKQKQYGEGAVVDPKIKYSSVAGITGTQTSDHPPKTEQGKE